MVNLLHPFLLLWPIVLLSCDLSLNEGEKSDDMGLVFLPWVVTPKSGNKDFRLEYHLYPGNLVPPGVLFAAKVKMVDEERYFFEDGRGKSSKEIGNGQEAYYQVNWDIREKGKESSQLLFLSPPDPKVFTPLDASTDPLTAGSEQKILVAYFSVGPEVPAGVYTLYADINDGDPTGKKVMKAFQLDFEVLPPFAFPENLRLEARGGTSHTHTVLGADPNMKPLPAVPVFPTGPATASAALRLTSSATVQKNHVFYYDFSLTGDDNYRITRYLAATWGSSPVKKVTSTSDTHSVELTGNSQDPKSGDFPLDIKDYAVWFTAKMPAEQDQGEIELEVANQYGQTGTLTVNLGAGH